MPTPPIIDSSTSANMIGQGAFIVGTVAAFFFTFSDEYGQLFDPSDINATILDNNNSTVITIDAADKLELGTYVLSWDIDESLSAGKYSISLEYTVETSSGQSVRSFSEQFVVGEAGGGFASFRRLRARAFLESLIHESQNIPVLNEPARFNNAKTIAELTFPRWNQNAGVRILVNDRVKESGFSVDYLNGKITFDRAVSVYDQVRVSYKFRWFTEDELDLYVDQGIQMFNIFPPQSVFNISIIPEPYLIASLHASAVFAIRRLLHGLQYQEPIKVYGSFERAQQVHANWMEQKKNYEETYKLLFEQKKFLPYRGRVATITAPVISLPGSRSRYFRMMFK